MLTSRYITRTRQEGSSDQKHVGRHLQPLGVDVDEVDGTRLVHAAGDADGEQCYTSLQQHVKAGDVALPSPSGVISAFELARIADKAGGRLDAALAAIDRASDGVADAVGQVESVGASIEHDSASLEKLEDRLYAIGPMTRGAWWEVVAVPDIRVQAWNLARTLANAHWVGGEGL